MKGIDIMKEQPFNVYLKNKSNTLQVDMEKEKEVLFHWKMIKGVTVMIPVRLYLQA